MTWHEEIASLRRELRDRIAWAVGSIFVFTRVSNTTALGDSDNVTLADDDTTNGQRPARRVEPFGFRSRPVAKQRSLAIKLGSSTVFYLGVASDGGYGPGDLEDGETALYCKQGGTEIRLDQNGNVKITATSGKDVIVNGGTADVGRVGDAVAVGTLAVSLSGTTPELTFTPTLADGTPGTSIGPSPSVALTALIKAGAPHFKG